MLTQQPAARPRGIAACAGAATSLCAGAAHASFLSGEAMDTAANVMAWVVICVVPLIGIAVFWIVHVLPEKIAHKRHHPQTAAIQTLCLLSLVFGGMLWPIAWLWAYTKPVGYKLAYGTEKGEHYFEEEGERARAGQLRARELDALRAELDALSRRGPLPPHLAQLRDDVAVLQPAPEAVPELTESVPGPTTAAPPRRTA